MLPLMCRPHTNGDTGTRASWIAQRQLWNTSAQPTRCRTRHINVGWPGFFHAAPEVQNTARNTDGFWVIHGGASRDTNKLLQDVAPLLATDLRRTFTVLCSCYTCPVRARTSIARGCEEQKKNMTLHPCDIVLKCPRSSSSVQALDS